MKIPTSFSNLRSGGFNRKELIVVLGVVTVLAVLGVLGIRLGKEHYLRTHCRINLMQIGGALKDFSQANGGLLPDCSAENARFSGAAWPWDISTNLIAELQQRGVTRNSLYCPANPAMNDVSHWEFWRFIHGSIRVISYGTLFNGQGQIPPDFWRKDLSGVGSTPPSQAELAFDATVSMNGDFARVVGIFTDRSNHMRGKQPSGGNILFEDMHAEWRDFAKMQFRFATIPNAEWYF